MLSAPELRFSADDAWYVDLRNWPTELGQWNDWNDSVTGIFVTTADGRTKINSNNYTIDKSNGRYKIPFSQIPLIGVLKVEIEATGYKTVELVPGPF